jgi:hypothetical protein
MQETRSDPGLVQLPLSSSILIESIQHLISEPVRRMSAILHAIGPYFRDCVSCEGERNSSRMSVTMKGGGSAHASARA